MRVLPLRPSLVVYLKKHNLAVRFDKQIKLLEVNIYHPSLHFELLEPKALRIFSFRINRKYRAICIFDTRDIIEIADITNHYQ